MLIEAVAAGGEEGALGRVPGQYDGLVVGRRGVGAAAEAAQQVGPGRVVQVVAVQVQRVDLRERGGGAVGLGQRDRAVERHHRGGRQGEQLVVQGKDLRPVGPRGGRRIAVHGCDRRLYLVEARLVPEQALTDDGLPL